MLTTVQHRFWSPDPLRVLDQVPVGTVLHNNGREFLLRSIEIEGKGWLSWFLQTEHEPGEVIDVAPVGDNYARTDTTPTMCGAPACGHRWRVAWSRVCAGGWLVCPRCGSPSRVIDVAHPDYIRTSWPV